MNWDPGSYKKSRSLRPTFNFNIMRISSVKVRKSELVLHLGVFGRDYMVWDSGLSRQNFAICLVFWHLLQVFRLKQDCLKWPLFWQKVQNFCSLSPDLVIANLRTCSVNFSTMFFCLSRLSESLLVDVDAKETVVLNQYYIVQCPF